MPLLDEIMTTEFWSNKTLGSIENMRRQVRDLLKYLISNSKIFVVNIIDPITKGGTTGPITRPVTYKQKVLDFLAENRDLPVLQKIKEIEQLTTSDIIELERIMWHELGTRDDYERYLRHERMTANIPVAAFIRIIIGLDRRKALSLFTHFISANTLTAEQEEFLNSILNNVCKNGDMDVSELSDNDLIYHPLTEYFPDNIAQVAQFVNYLHNAITVA